MYVEEDGCQTHLGSFLESAGARNWFRRCLTTHAFAKQALAPLADTASMGNLPFVVVVGGGHHEQPPKLATPVFLYMKQLKGAEGRRAIRRVLFYLPQLEYADSVQPSSTRHFQRIFLGFRPSPFLLAGCLV